ncbi:hypothetical protein DY000_02040029 [Brassica cretica]|uniref:Uncharacterized protein n=1 Tax=Brassica cretica TaxID=69181 RepID=A0ABQ7B7U3_BRACR|nr:hypothetical protein DY000_02040029 [Brassica cretica]
MDLQGIVASTPEEVGNLTVCHFKAILGLPFTAVTPHLLPLVQFFTVYHCSEDLRLTLAKIPSADEIMKTLFKLNPNKSPWPDGLTSRFYSAAWHTKLTLSAQLQESQEEFYL